MLNLKAAALLVALVVSEDAARENQDGAEEVHHFISEDVTEPIHGEDENTELEQDDIVCTDGRRYVCDPALGDCYPNSPMYCDEGKTEEPADTLNPESVLKPAERHGKDETDEDYDFEPADEKTQEDLDMELEFETADVEEVVDTDDEKVDSDDETERSDNQQEEDLDPDFWFDDLPEDSEEEDPNDEFDDLVFIDGYYYHMDDVLEIFDPEDLEHLGLSEHDLQDGADIAKFEEVFGSDYGKDEELDKQLKEMAEDAEVEKPLLERQNAGIFKG